MKIYNAEETIKIITDAGLSNRSLTGHFLDYVNEIRGQSIKNKKSVTKYENGFLAQKTSFDLYDVEFLNNNSKSGIIKIQDENILLVSATLFKEKCKNDKVISTSEGGVDYQLNQDFIRKLNQAVGHDETIIQIPKKKFVELLKNAEMDDVIIQFGLQEEGQTKKMKV